MASSYYCPSGRVPATAYLVLAMAAVFTLPVTVLYAVLSAMTPPVIAVLFTVVHLVYVIRIAAWAIEFGKVRSPAWASRAAMALGALACYCHWAVWVVAKGGAATEASLDTVRDALWIAMHPQQLFTLAIQLTRVDLQGFGPELGNIALGLLVACWLIEFGLHLRVPQRQAREQAEAVFCECADRWAETLEVAQRFAFVSDGPALVRQLELEPHLIKHALSPWIESEASSYAELYLHLCEDGDSFATLVNFRATGQTEDMVVLIGETVFDALRLSDLSIEHLTTSWSQAAGKPLLPDLPATHADHPAIRKAMAAYGRGDYRRAASYAARCADAPDPSLRTDATRIRALAAMQCQEWREAVDQWHVVMATAPDVAAALQMACCIAQSGDLEDALACFGMARSLNAMFQAQAPIQLQLPFCLALHRAGHASAALEQLTAVRDVYARLGTTAPEALRTHQLPSFMVFLARSEAMVRARLDRQRARAWYETLLIQLDAAGKATLSRWIERRFGSAPAISA